MLRNIQVLCPSFATPVINLYRGEAELFVGGETCSRRKELLRAIPWRWLFMPSPHFLSLTALNREASLKHGLQMMLVVDQGWRPFTPGGCDSSARDRSTDISLILQKPGCWSRISIKKEPKNFSATPVSASPLLVGRF